MRLLTCLLVPLLAMAASVASQPVAEAVAPGFASLRLLDQSVGSHVPTIMFVLLGFAAGRILRRQVSSPLHLLLTFVAPAAWAMLVFWLAFIKGEEIGMPPELMAQNLFLAFAPALGVALGLITHLPVSRSRVSV